MSFPVPLLDATNRSLENKGLPSGSTGYAWYPVSEYQGDITGVDQCFQNLQGGYSLPSTSISYNLPSSSSSYEHILHSEVNSFGLCPNVESDKYITNPIVNSLQYQAYRARQEDHDHHDEQKWPSDLEAYFLDALMDVPPMGRQKYTFDGKPHGRNELISLYIWIAYTESLPPGVSPDPMMKRHRKQVSSHIQVLKKFMQGHKAFNQIFQPIEAILGSGASFENNPCLVALSQGCLPSKSYRDQIRYEYYRRFLDPNEIDTQVLPTPCVRIRPVVFSLAMLSPTSTNRRRNQINQGPYDTNLQRCARTRYQLTNLSKQLSTSTLDAIPQWSIRFPQILRLLETHELDCVIIHMQVSLNLLSFQPGRSAELLSQTVLSVPTGQPDDSEWRVFTELTQLMDFSGNQKLDTLIEPEIFSGRLQSKSQLETRIIIPFPDQNWSMVFSCLYMRQAGNEEAQRASSSENNYALTARLTHVEQMSMYQEVYSNLGPNTPFVRQAIILSTFELKTDGRSCLTDWRYLTPPPNIAHQLSAPIDNNISNSLQIPPPLPNFNIFESNGTDIEMDIPADGIPFHFTGPYQSPIGHSYLPYNHHFSFDHNVLINNQSSLSGRSSSAVIRRNLFSPSTSASQDNNDENSQINWQNSNMQLLNTHDQAWELVSFSLPLGWESSGSNANASLEVFEDLLDPKISQSISIESRNCTDLKMSQDTTPQ